MRLIALIATFSLVLVGCDHGSQRTVTNPNGVKPTKITYLKKANNEVVSHCTCGDGRVTFPPQMDCPWCGCGWLFTCVTCRKAFTFAEGVEIESTWEEIAREDLRNKWHEEPVDEDVQAWINAMQEILSPVESGSRYVILDGRVIPADAEDVEFDGWHAHHKFARMPQTASLTDDSVIERQLGNRQYWAANALSDNSESTSQR